MIRLLDLQKQFILAHLKEGDTAVDFTMGNGHDTEFLSKTVGEKGRVYAFDIQEAAIASTRENLKKGECPENYTLIHDSHHNCKSYVEGKIKAGMFNLGYLPGGDKNITTMRATTMPAIEAAISMLDRDAILSIAIYPGHEEGDLEGKMVEDYLSSLDRFTYSIAQIKIINSPTSPYFMIVETK
jgi:hypothetical protein